MSSIGVAVSPILALLNHSCQPNTHFVFPAYPSPLNVKPMRLLATSRIEIGEEITTSYLATALSGRKRREYLQENYQFDCECTLCLTEMAGLDLDVREALLCSDRQCKGLIPMPSQLPSFLDSHIFNRRLIRFHCLTTEQNLEKI